MTDFEAVGGEHQAFADDLGAFIHARITSATPIETLSERGDKLLQVMQEPDGQTFVTRSFTESAVREVEKTRMDFVEAWDAMHSVFRDAGIDIVPSYLLAGQGKYPFIVVSEHVTNVQPIDTAPTEVKKDLVERFGQLIQPNRDGFFISPQMINKDMFQLVLNKEGVPRVTLIDTDPHILPNMYDSREDGIQATYIDLLAKLFWEEWCKPDERVAVLSRLTTVMGDIVGEDLDIFSKTGIALHKIQMMANGIAPANMPQF